MNAPVTRVSASWLALREDADAAARSAELAARLARRVTHGGVLVVHDLGGGSGAMGRWLAPRLPGPQQWVVHDRDAELLEEAVDAPPAAAADGAAVRVQARRSDITHLADDDLAGAGLVVASALLDLLTADELAAMLDAWSRRCPLLLALSVTGRAALAPAEPFDARIAAAFDAHQRRRVAGSRLLGPDAAAVAARALREAGDEVLVRASPWRLGADERDLTAAWLEGWLAAAGEQEPTLAEELGPYRARRHAQAAAGRLAVTVDHADLLVVP